MVCCTLTKRQVKIQCFHLAHLFFIKFSQKMAAFIVGVCLVGVVVVSLFLRLISKSRTNYDGKHIVITGGSEGIGRSLALEFSKSSAHVTVIARTEQKLADAVLEMKSLAKPHQKIDYACADVTNEDQVQLVFFFFLNLAISSAFLSYKTISSCFSLLPLYMLILWGGLSLFMNLMISLNQ